MFCFFNQKTAYEMRISDWSSDVCSSDLDSLRREQLGRPWITFLIEIWTRSILGYYVSFGDPSLFRCGRAVASDVLPKEPALAHLGVDVSYPMHGLFRRLHSDPAKQHRSEDIRSAGETDKEVWGESRVK